MLVNHGKLWISWFAVVIHDVMPETRKCASWIFVCFYRVAIPLEEEISLNRGVEHVQKNGRHVEMSAHSWLDVWLPLADFGVSTAFRKLSKCNNDYSCLYISTVSTLGRLLSTFYHVAVFTGIDIDSIDIPKNDETSQASWNLAAPRLHGYDPKELGLLQGAVPGGSPVGPRCGGRSSRCTGSKPFGKMGGFYEPHVCRVAPRPFRPGKPKMRENVRKTWEEYEKIWKTSWSCYVVVSRNLLVCGSTNCRANKSGEKPTSNASKPGNRLIVALKKAVQFEVCLPEN